MRLFCLVSILLISALSYGQDHPQSKSASENTAQENANSGDNAPPQIQTGAPHAPAKPNDEQNSSKQPTQHWLTHGEWVMAILTGIYVVLTGVYVLISHRTLVTIKNDVESGTREFNAQLKTAQDSAGAMTTIAETIKVGNKAVTRAYLTVVVNAGVFQERGVPGQNDKKFQGIPKLLNTGMTPARKIGIRINAQVMPIPIPKDFAFPFRTISATTETPQFLSLGAHQNADLMGGIVDDFVADHEVAEIKEGSHKALCVWGTVTYEDIFGDAHTTKFGQQLSWWTTGAVHALYIPGQNDAD